MRVRIALLSGTLLLLAACAGEPGTTTTPSSTTTSSSTTTTVTSTTATEATTTTTAATTTTSQPIDVFYEGGQVVGPDRFTRAIGEEVSVWVLSDIDDEIHVHGYDLLFPAKAGVPIEITLTADVPGIFEVELESSHTLLFELEITS